MKHKKETCPNCNGKGHVFDAVGLLVIPFGILFAPFERNDPRGLTRQECTFCDGTGKVLVDR